MYMPINLFRKHWLRNIAFLQSDLILFSKFHILWLTKKDMIYNSFQTFHLDSFFLKALLTGGNLPNTFFLQKFLVCLQCVTVLSSPQCFQLFSGPPIHLSPKFISLKKYPLSLISGIYLCMALGHPLKHGWSTSRHTPESKMTLSPLAAISWP